MEATSKEEILDIEKIATEYQEKLIEMIKTVALIPSPTFNEGAKAKFCCEYIKKLGYTDVSIDEVGNVVLKIEGSTGKFVVFMAHMDTVFQLDTKLEIKEDENFIYCPSIGDNSAHIAGLFLAAEIFKKYDMQPKGDGVVFVFSVCEEGAGKMRGAKHFIEKNKGCIKEFYSADTNYNHVTVGKMGIARYEVEINAPGGHSWHDFGKPSAVAQMADVICQIYSIALPQKKDSITTYNVGTIEGGSAINAIAERCAIRVDIRSDDIECFAEMKQKVGDIYDLCKNKGYNLTVKLLSDDAVLKLETEEQKDIVNRRVEIIKKWTKFPCEFVSCSLDGNAALYAGIPATSIGLCINVNAHSENEYIEKQGIGEGFISFLATILSYFEA